MSITLSGLLGNTYQGLQGLQGAQGIAGAAAAQGLQGPIGLQGIQGLQGNTGIQGAAGGSNSFFPYQADAVSTSGQPASGYLLWNNASQTSATQINVFHITQDGVDVEYFLQQIQVGQTLTIQSKNASQDYQEFELTGSPTVVNGGGVNAYVTYPVTLTSSGGQGTSGFANNASLELVLSQQGVQGITGTQGIQGLQGEAGTIGVNGTQGTQGVQGLTGAGTQGVQGLQGTSATGTQGTQGLQGPSGAGSSGITSTDDAATNASFYPVMVNAAGSTSNIIVTTTKLYFNPSTGNMSATQFNTLSDARLKTDITMITNPLEMLSDINGYKFTFVDTGIPSVGVLAQEVEAILPELVATNPNGDKTVSYNGIIGLLVEAVKELKVKIEK